MRTHNVAIQFELIDMWDSSMDEIMNEVRCAAEKLKPELAAEAHRAMSYPIITITGTDQ